MVKHYLNIKKTIIISILILLSSCCKEDGSEKAKEKDIYISGYITKGAKTIATYWKNGEINRLTDGINNAMASKVELIGDDIYVIGWEAVNNTNTIGKIWKNGISTNITDGTKQALLLDFTVSNGVLHVIGLERNQNSVNSMYLVDGKRVSLGNNRTEIYEIINYRNDIYIVGGEYVSIANAVYVTAVYWKNNTKYIINSNPSIASGIVFSNNKLFISGMIGIGPSFDKSEPAYWIDNVEKRMSNSNFEAYAGRLEVSDNDVYIAGTETRNNKNMAVYWKNGAIARLSQNESSAAGIAILNNEVHVVGIEEIGNNEVATLWKGGFATKLYVDNNNSGCTSIFIK